MTQAESTLAKLTSFPTELEAGVLIAELEEHGIRATMTGIHTANFRAEAPGRVDVLVDDSELVRALAVLDALRRESEQVDWSQIDVGRPEETETSAAVPWWISRRCWIRLAAILIIVDFVAWSVWQFVRLLTSVL